MSGMWRDEVTGGTVEFCSSYQGESTYQFKGGVIGEWPAAKTFRIVNAPGQSPDLTTPKLLAYYHGMPGDAPTPAVLEVWTRFCEASQADFLAWCRERVMQ